MFFFLYVSCSILKVIPSNVVKPLYQRPGDGRFLDYYMCHMGVGGFHRSHQAVYTDDLLNLAASLEAKGEASGMPSKTRKKKQPIKTDGFILSLTAAMVSRDTHH